MKTFDIIVGIILVAAGLNWGMVGLFDFNIVAAVFGEMTFLTRLLYVIVGLAALYDVVTAKAIWKRWDVHFERHAHA